MNARPGNPGNYMKLEVEIIADFFPTVVYFNRYRIDHLEDFVVLHVATVLPDSVMGETFSFAIEKSALGQLRTNVLEYLDRIPSKPHDLKASHAILSGGTRVASFNVISCSHSGEAAEIMLNNYPLKASAEAQRSKNPKTKVKAQGIALLYSQLAVHRNLLFALFTKNANRHS
jgi:hypothetical protein